MGYTTEFSGEIEIEPPLNDFEVGFLQDFSNTRRMNRTNGPLFVRSQGFRGQDDAPDIVDYNSPPKDQPGLRCHWITNTFGDFLEWDGGEKFYSSEEWMEYLIDNLFSPEAKEYVTAHIDEDPRLKNFTFDHVFNGVIDAQGEDPEDMWKLVVEDNKVRVRHAKIVWEDE